MTAAPEATAGASGGQRLLSAACAWIRFALPGLLLPSFLFILPLCGCAYAAKVAWCAYLSVQVLYLLVIEWCRRDRALSPTETVEMGAPEAEKCAILVHGFADTPLAWQREAEALVARGWRVIVPEINLSAASDAWLSTIHAAILRAKRSADHVELWGHSMGGALCLVAAQREAVARLVLWAPFLEPYMGVFCSRLLYGLHRVCFLWPFTLTWFPVNRHGKGDPETFYRVRRVIPTRTFASALAVPEKLASQPPACPITLLLSQRDTVVRNAPVLRRYPQARVLWAENPRSSHALTNAVDWKINLERLLDET